MGKAANLYEDAGYKLQGSSYVINKLLGTTWLWDRVRVVRPIACGCPDFVGVGTCCMQFLRLAIRHNLQCCRRILQ